MSFKKIFPHIFVLFCFIILLWLGTWQLLRREYKSELIDKINTRTSSPAIKPAEFRSIDDDEYKIMQATGKFVNSKEILLLNRSYNGKQGQHVYTVFNTGDEQIIVNRGWVPSSKDPQHPEDELTIKGVVRASQQLNFIGRHVIFDNEPGSSLWFWVDLPELYKFFGIAEKDYYLDMINETGSKSYPLALNAKIEPYNEHLQYAITWYSLSIVLILVYYFRFHRQVRYDVLKRKHNV